MNDKSEKLPDFEKSLEELELLVEQLESGEMNLDQSLKQFKRGVELTRHCQKVLDRARARTLRMPGLVPAMLRHQCEIFGQYGECAAASCRVRQQLRSELEILLEVGTTVHLDGCYPHNVLPLLRSFATGFYSESRMQPACSARDAKSAAPVLSIMGSSHGPSIA